MTKTHDKAFLQALLAERNRDTARHAEIDAAIEQAFVRTVSMLALDMCGFTSTTCRHGIIHFLAMVQRMEQAARPAIAANGGEVIKQEADNLFAVFANPQQALEGALDILRALDAMNAVQPAEYALDVSIGIGFGATLVVAGDDLFGPEMNLACKLGEDIAGPRQILLSPAAKNALPPEHYLFQEIVVSVGGAEQRAFELQACLVERPLGVPAHTKDLR